MDKILLVNVDSTIPNLALEKLSVYHKQRGDKIYKIKDESLLPFFIDAYDKIYVSCVFDYNKYRCRKWRGIAEIGGSGYSLRKRLPTKIEKIKPKINLGFTTRGCIRNCHFCIVPKKEGKIRVVGDIYDLWDGQSKNILLMDNNILAAPKHFFKISSQLKNENLIVDFNQGLDHRLLTDKICQELLSLTYPGFLRFAFDHISYKKSVIRALRMLKKNGMKTHYARWYVYVGIQDTVANVLERVNILRDAGQMVFLMRDKDKKVRDNQEFSKIYAWTFNIGYFFAETYPAKRRPKIDDRPNLFEIKGDKK